MLGRVTGLAISLMLLAGTTPTRAEDFALEARAAMVTVQRKPTRSWAGFGVYLGDGLVLTAAHVAGQNPLMPPLVLVAGRPVDVTVLKLGRYPDDDLAVLRLDAPVPVELAQRHVTLCEGPPQPGEAVIVATPDGVATSAVIAPDILPPEMRARYAASIKDVTTTGNSGSGVFDVGQRCLLGIMSSKIEQELHGVVDGQPVTRKVGLAKHFVPPADIKAFLVGVPTR
ncbi:trypsin-like peptidase domain-containing protein [Lichenihabitans sp. Uapishka_5]|uniref:trypsin-like peptidase domain-containing protein n=1 Tax=Lichenihabitans sp. Uapishka_5 TaxID=3037302 RepID=UPI0029E80ACC|nr:trypsin-like peptidase domain-containing protein [Lichenihabitans sp. Uapishka_5]MDX7952188.1 trypsin-like peptidase domain-containing protein [Lichenihabitans sp. Uapishka_5]